MVIFLKHRTSDAILLIKEDEFRVNKYFGHNHVYIYKTTYVVYEQYMSFPNPIPCRLFFLWNFLLASGNAGSCNGDNSVKLLSTQTENTLPTSIQLQQPRTYLSHNEQNFPVSKQVQKVAIYLPIINLDY